MLSLDRIVAELAREEVPILLLGESGVGKQALAAEIHRLSSRYCFTIISPNELAAKRAQLATGDLSQHTIFLSHVGELSASEQAQLYEFLFVECGNDGGGPRLIASAPANLEEQVRNGSFREDLFYRMGVVCLRIPPLRQRKDDIAALAKFFACKYSVLLDCRVELTTETVEVMSQYPWLGNVRELEQLVRRIVAFGDSRITADLLRAAEGNNGNHAALAPSLSLKQAARTASRQAERTLILDVLSRTRWNRKRAARELQISYKALLYKLKQIGIEDDEQR